MRIGFSSFATSIVAVWLALAASGCSPRGTESRFYLYLERSPPLYLKGRPVLYDPPNINTWAQVIRARRFFEQELAPALAQRREALIHEELLQHLTTWENENLFALDVRFQLDDATREQNVIAALREALDHHYGQAVASGYRGALEIRPTPFTESEFATLREMSSRPHRLVIRTEALPH